MSAAGGFRISVVNVQLVPKPLTVYEIMRPLWDILDQSVVFKNITQHLESRVPKVLIRDCVGTS